MAFDSATLHTELVNDPNSLGYASLVTAAKDQAIADVLNLVRAGGTYTVFRNDISVREVVNAIVAADFASLTQLQVSKLMLMFTSSTTVDATNSNTRTIFLGIFTGMTNTITALTALAQRQGSRAEVLFGTGTVITAAQVGAAR